MEATMLRKFLIASIFLILCSSNSAAGLYSSDNIREAVTVVAAVQIKGKGIYNLVVTIQFLRKPQDSKIYKSDENERFMDRLLIQSRGIALKKILERKEIAVSDFYDLKKVIETDIANLATQLKKNLFPNQNIEVVFSISDFYLLEPRDR
jgi:hypothetical protein